MRALAISHRNLKWTTPHQSQVSIASALSGSRSPSKSEAYCASASATPGDVPGDPQLGKVVFRRPRSLMLPRLCEVSMACHLVRGPGIWVGFHQTVLPHSTTRMWARLPFLIV